MIISNRTNDIRIGTKNPFWTPTTKGPDPSVDLFLSERKARSWRNPANSGAKNSLGLIVNDTVIHYMTLLPGVPRVLPGVPGVVGTPPRVLPTLITSIFNNNPSSIVIFSNAFLGGLSYEFIQPASGHGGTEDGDYDTKRATSTVVPVSSVWTTIPWHSILSSL